MSDIATKLTTIAENQQRVYDAGFASGQSAGGDTENAYNEGKESERKALWDAIQNYGNRTSYNYGFAKTNWTHGTFKPRYPITAVGDASYMFDNCVFTDIDFVEDEITLDVSGATSLTYLFRNAVGIKRLGVIDCTGCQNLNRLFYSCKVKTIDKFIVEENITYSVPFEYTRELENITIEGVIGNTISFSFCSLTRDSLLSVMEALSDNVTGKTLTLNQIAVNAAFSTDEWNAMVAKKPNWTIALA